MLILRFYSYLVIFLIWDFDFESVFEGIYHTYELDLGLYAPNPLPPNIVLNQNLWIGAWLHNCLNFYCIFKTSVVFQSPHVWGITNVQKSEKFAKVVF